MTIQELIKALEEYQDTYSPDMEVTLEHITTSKDITLEDITHLMVKPSKEHYFYEVLVLYSL